MRTAEAVDLGLTVAGIHPPSLACGRDSGRVGRGELTVGKGGLRGVMGKVLTQGTLRGDLTEVLARGHRSS